MVKRHLLDQGYARMLAHFGIDAAEALRMAGAPEDTFAHKYPTMSAEDYFAFMEAAGRLAPSEDVAIRLASTEGIEQFSPPIFASYCSSDGNACIARLARYKRLVGPMVMLVTGTEETSEVEVEFSCPNIDQRMPVFLVECELAFLVNLLRTATRQHVVPVRVRMQECPSGNSFADFLDCAVELSASNSVTFRTSDLALPFVSRNDAMWDYFEPELSRRLSELDADDSTAARVRSALIELLPAGESGIGEVARKLGMSARTLQRRLGNEQTSYQRQLNHTRELLAKHYLSTTTMGSNEVAYLLGYTELNSFLRAFASWTGTTVTGYRARMTTRCPA